MDWLDKLERKMGKICIKELSNYVMFINAVVYILDNYVAASGEFINKLMLDPSLVMKGEVSSLMFIILLE